MNSLLVMGNLSHREDRDLLLAFLNLGDEAAFEQLVKNHHAMMFRSAFRVLGNQEDAQDALQAALIVFARRASELDTRKPLGPWLHRVVLLQAANLKRKQSRRIRRETEAMKQEDSLTPTKSPALLTELDKAIDSLNTKDRVVVVLHHLEGRTFPAIAKQLGGSSEGWRKRCARALEKLSQKLGRHEAPVAATVLATLLSQQQAEAIPVSTQILQGLTREALTQSSLAPSGAITFFLMNFKLLLFSSFLGGGLLSLGWNLSSESNDQARGIAARSSSAIESNSPTREPRTGFNLESVLAAIRIYAASPQRDRWQENSLRLLMFSVPDSKIEIVLEALQEHSHQARFYEIATALYARWAEIDPEEAWEATIKEESFSTQARRGVLLTWLNRDREAAFMALMESPHQNNLNILSEFLREEVQHTPHQAALFVDQIMESWPAADRKLFPLVARAWATFDPDSAGEWVSSHAEVEVRERLLRQLAQRAARDHGFKGFGLANLIETPQKRKGARLNTARWLGISRGGRLFRDSVQPENDLRDGYPEDWSLDELSQFALGTMANYADSYPLLVNHASSEEQRQNIYRGVIQGASFSRPDQVAAAVTALDQEMLASHPEMKQKLEAFILRWREMDAKASGDWLNQQAADKKTAIMRQALSSN